VVSQQGSQRRLHLGHRDNRLHDPRRSPVVNRPVYQHLAHLFGLHLGHQVSPRTQQVSRLASPQGDPALNQALTHRGDRPRYPYLVRRPSPPANQQTPLHNQQVDLADGLLHSPQCSLRFSLVLDHPAIQAVSRQVSLLRSLRGVRLHGPLEYLQGSQLQCLQQCLPVVLRFGHLVSHLVTLLVVRANSQRRNQPTFRRCSQQGNLRDNQRRSLPQGLPDGRRTVRHRSLPSSRLLNRLSSLHLIQARCLR
jgi:hypothetical protein